MQIETLISHLQAIAAKHPNIQVHTHDGLDPSDLCPITEIKLSQGWFTSDTTVLELVGSTREIQPFDINKF